MEITIFNVVFVCVFSALMTGVLLPAKWLALITAAIVGFVLYLYASASGGWAGEGYFAVALAAQFGALLIATMWLSKMVKWIIMGLAKRHTPPN